MYRYLIDGLFIDKLFVMISETLFYAAFSSLSVLYANVFRNASLTVLAGSANAAVAATLWVRRNERQLERYSTTFLI